MEENEERGVFLNSTKSLAMVFWKSDVIPTCKITVHGNTLDQVDKFVYLGNLFTSNADTNNIYDGEEPLQNQHSHHWVKLSKI